MSSERAPHDRAAGEQFRVIASTTATSAVATHAAPLFLAWQMGRRRDRRAHAAGVERAHVYGISLRRDDRAGARAAGTPIASARLVLGAPRPGAAAGDPRRNPTVLTFFTRVGAMGPEEAEWPPSPYSYGERTRREHGQRIPRTSRSACAIRRTRSAYLHQVAVAASHNTYGRLGTSRADARGARGHDRCSRRRTARARRGDPAREADAVAGCRPRVHDGTSRTPIARSRGSWSAIRLDARATHRRRSLTPRGTETDVRTEVATALVVAGAVAAPAGVAAADDDPAPTPTPDRRPPPRLRRPLPPPPSTASATATRST